MRVLPRSALRRGLLVAAALIALCPAGALAATVPGRLPLPQGQVRSSAPAAAQPWHAVRVGPHLLYGTITAVRGTVITLRLRSGRSQIVDAAAAIANGDYSAPLFVGKLVSVDGDVRGTVFVAAHVFRMENLTNLQADT